MSILSIAARLQIPIRTIAVAAAIGLSFVYLGTRGLKLGLDLEGGMHVALEVDDPDGSLTYEGRSDVIDRAERIIRTRVDEFGVEEHLIQKVGDGRLIVELGGLDDENRAKEVIFQQAQLEWKLVLPTSEIDLERLDRAVVAAIGEEGPREMGHTAEETGAPSIQDLLFAVPDTGAAEFDFAVSRQEEADAEPELNFRPFGSLLRVGGPGSFLVESGDVAEVQRFMNLPEFQRALPRDVSLHWGEDSRDEELRGLEASFYRELYVLEEDAFLTGEQLEDARANRDPESDQAQVLFKLNRRGGSEFQRLTGANIGEQIAIVLDGEVVSAPEVRAQIGTHGSIDLGNPDMSEARDLALVLRAGALPAQLRIMEERTVGPSLGQDSIDQGRIAGIVGVAAVLLIMVLYYRVAGILAIVALGVYLLLVMGGLSGINATLTLPGIAGLILSVGMAVDANVLIFERIREELERNRAPRTAVDEGFGNAMSAIVDANITTLITGLILFQFGTGPVRGFAVTLCIGIVASFFSALYVTRTLFLVYLQRKRASDPISI